MTCTTRRLKDELELGGSQVYHDETKYRVRGRYCTIRMGRSAFVVVITSKQSESHSFIVQ